MGQDLEAEIAVRRAASRAGTTYSYDLMSRIANENLSDGGQTTHSYSDAVPYTITTNQLVQSGLNIQRAMVLDGLGRPSQSQLNDPDCGGGTGLVKVDYAYGYVSLQGRTTQKSTPYCNTPDGTYGIMATTNYDAIGRVKSLVQSDGSTITTAYGSTSVGLTTIVTDEAAKARKSQTDALGRMTAVWEDPSGLNYETDYNYDVLDNLLSVTQKGAAASGSWRNRGFTYDSLSRLVCAANPEITPGMSTVNPAVCPASYTGIYTNGTIGYSYDAASNLTTKTSPAPNQTSSSSTVIAAYSYDKDNRLSQISYSGGPATPTVQYGYDGTPLLGCTTTPPSLSDSNAIGYRTSMCDGSGATSWSHDPLGRVFTEERTINGASAITKSIVYNYYLDGELQKITYPGTGRKVTYTPNSSGGYSAGRIVSAVNSPESINYITSATYAPQGGVATINIGGSIFAGFSYNSRMQPLQMYYGTNPPPSLSGTACPSTVGNIMHRIYNFGLGTNDNGNVNVITNCRDTNRTANFFYDSLNRITQAYTTGSSPLSTSWGETFTIDPWGNLTNKTGVSNKTNTELFNASPANIKNQLNGFCNDAAGNLVLSSNCPTGTFTPTYTYDAENRLTGAAGYTYVYDADGNRVKKCANATCTNLTLYWIGIGGDPLSESGSSGGISEEYIFFNGSRIARRDNSTGAVHYYFSDHLGSADVITDDNGAIQEESDYYPYGGEIPVTGSDSNHYKFTGRERDSETGLDNLAARYHASSISRFMSADALQPSRSHPLVLQQFLSDPQNWNKYAYTVNNPIKSGDRGGHFTSDDHEKMMTNAMLANGFSTGAARIAARADAKMDTVSNMIGGIAGLHHVWVTGHNAEHGERADHQSRWAAEKAADTFMSSKVKDAASRALKGDVRGALTALGQASHTAQDIVRHNFEPASQHGWSEPPATPSEKQAAGAATQDVLNEFGDQLFEQGSQQGLTLDQIIKVYQSVQQGPAQESHENMVLPSLDAPSLVQRINEDD